MRLQFPWKAIKAHTGRLVRDPRLAGTRSPRSPLRTPTLRLQESGELDGVC